MSSPPVETLDAELRELLASWEYAFAMGSQCALGPRDPRLQYVLDRVDELRGLIALRGGSRK